jgi:hypothetical protein
MLPAARRRRRLRLRRIKIVVAWVILGILIGTPIALAFFATTPRHPFTAPPD